MALPNPYILGPHDAYRGRIELAANVTISVREFKDDEDFGTGFYAWANRADSEHWDRSHTVASEWANTKIAALDSLARQLGVPVGVDEARLNEAAA